MKLICKSEIRMSKKGILSMSNHNKMSQNPLTKRMSKSLDLKKARRKMNKRNKLNAFIEVSKRNEEDRQKRSSHNSVSNPDSISNEVAAEGPEHKRLKKDVQYPLNGQEKSTEAPQVFGELTDDQKKLVKKLLEQRLKKRLERPFLQLNEVGEVADLKTPAERRVPLTIDDFQHFIIYSLLNNMSTKGLSRWAQLMKSDKVEHRIFVVIEGAGLKEYLEHEADLATLREFESRLEIITPLSYGANLIEELAMVPMTNSQKSKLAEEYGSIKNAIDAGEIHNAMKTIFRITKSTAPKAVVQVNYNPEGQNVGPDKFSRTLLLLSPWDMIEENYPLPLGGKIGRKCSDYVLTRDDYEEVTDSSPMWSLDCEMCLTSKGSELTRISIVNEAHEVIYETLVKPYNPIVNYLTQFSGITPGMLRDCETRLEDVQNHIRSICPPDLILIGQSLNGDLHALKMMHPYVIDTSVIFNLSGIKHRKSKLRILTEEFLSEKIQTGKHGHSPIEDALAAMKLVQTKLQHSLGWGNAVLSGPRSEEESEAARRLLEEREKTGNAQLKGLKSHPLSDMAHSFETQLSTSLMSHLVRYDKNVLLIGKQPILDEWSQYCNVSKGVELSAVPTQKAAVKFAKRLSPKGGTTILHLSLSTRTPSNAIAKADRLVEKLLRNPIPNTLYTVLLAGRQDSPGNGLMFIHLLRGHVPFVRIPMEPNISG